MLLVVLVEVHIIQLTYDFKSLESFYCKVFLLYFLSSEKAVKTVKKLQDQMNIRRYERPSTSAPSSVQPVDTSAAQHQLASVKDDYQVSLFDINRV